MFAKDEFFFLLTNVQLLFQYHLLKRGYVLQEGMENPHLPNDKYLQSKNPREQVAYQKVRSSTTKDETTESQRDGQKRQTQYSQDSFSKQATNKQKDNHSCRGTPPGGRDLNPTSGSPALRSCTGKTGLQNLQLCKPVRLINGRNERLQETKLGVKGYTQNPIHFRTKC